MNEQKEPITGKQAHVLRILQYRNGHTRFVAEFGQGRLSMGIDPEETSVLVVHLDELWDAYPLGTYVGPDNIKTPLAFGITLRFPTADSVDNFIGILQAYRNDIFGNGRTDHPDQKQE